MFMDWKPPWHGARGSGSLHGMELGGSGSLHGIEFGVLALSSGFWKPPWHGARGSSKLIFRFNVISVNPTRHV